MKKLFILISLLCLSACNRSSRDMMLEAYLRVNLPYFEDLTVEEWGETTDSMYNPRAAERNFVYVKQKTLELTQRSAEMWDKLSWVQIDSMQRLVQQMDSDSVVMAYDEALKALEHVAFCIHHPANNCLGQTVRYHCNGLLQEDIVFYNEDGRIANLFSLLRENYSQMTKEQEKFHKALDAARADIENIKKRTK